MTESAEVEMAESRSTPSRVDWGLKCAASMIGTVLLLAGCTAGTAATTPSYQGVVAGSPTDAGPPVSATNTGPDFVLPLSVAWAKSGQLLYVTTYGGSSCPKVVEAGTSVVSTGSQRLTLRTSNPPSGIAPKSCTADLAPTTSAVSVPADIDPSKPLTVVIDDRTLEVPGRR